MRADVRRPGGSTGTRSPTVGRVCPGGSSWTLILVVLAGLVSAPALPARGRVIRVLDTDPVRARTLAAGIARALADPSADVGVRVPAAPGRDWSTTTRALTAAVFDDGADALVVGPRRELAHLALQYSVQTGIPVILVGVRDEQAATLPVRQACFVPLAALTARALEDAGARAGALLGSPPDVKPSWIRATGGTPPDRSVSSGR